jgi:hypothetical protein
VDQYLTNLPASQKLCLADFLKAKETSDSTWLRRLITEHLQRTRFWWQLYPGLLTQRFRHFRNLSPMKRVSCFPAALASSCLAIFTSYAAWKHLQAGSPDYWPKAPRAASKGAPQDSPPALQTCLPKP